MKTPLTANYRLPTSHYLIRDAYQISDLDPSAYFGIIISV